MMSASTPSVTLLTKAACATKAFSGASKRAKPFKWYFEASVSSVTKATRPWTPMNNAATNVRLDAPTVRKRDPVKRTNFQTERRVV